MLRKQGFCVADHQIEFKCFFNITLDTYFRLGLPPLMQPRHYLSDAAGVVAPDEADLGGALAEGLEAHQVVRVDHPAGELPDRPDRHVPQHPHRQAGQVRPGCRLDGQAIQDGPSAVLRLPIKARLAVANEGW